MRGVVRHGFRVLEVASGNVPNTIAAVLLQIAQHHGRGARRSTSSGPRATPSPNMLRFLVAGEGEVAPVTREVLRETEHDVRRRPMVHVS